jgi:hypothetical protein
MDNDVKRKKIDIIYQDVLGEVGDILKKLEEVQRDVTTTKETSAAHIQELESIFTTFHEETFDVIRQQLMENMELLKKAVDERTLASTEAAKADIQKAAIAFLPEISKNITETIKSVFDREMESSIEAVRTNIAALKKEAATVEFKLNNAVKAAQERIEEIQPNSKWEGLIYAMIGSGVGAVSMVIAISIGGIHVS